jgi:hypothetical protein
VDSQRREAIEDLRAEPLPLWHDVDAEIRLAADLIFAHVFLLLGVSYVLLVATGVFGYALFRRRHSAGTLLTERERT